MNPSHERFQETVIQLLWAVASLLFFGFFTDPASYYPHILRKLCQHWIGSQYPEGCLLWAVASLCFFRSGELVVASESDFVHVSWGYVAVNNPAAQTMLKIHQRRSKCDQFGKGVDVFVGQSGNELCLTVAYSAVRGNALSLHRLGLKYPN